MAKAELKGRPEVVLTLTEREASFLAHILEYCIDWSESDHAEEIYEALDEVVQVDRFNWEGKYNPPTDMFEVTEVTNERA